MSNLSSSINHTQPNEAVGPRVLSLSDIRHSYGRTRALRGIDFDVRPGEIRGLIGENGSGKSTLVKLLSGVMTPTTGTMAWEGVPTTFRSPRSAQRAGIATVFQETLIAGESSVRDNIFLGQDGLLRHGASASAERARAKEFFDVFDLSCSILDEPVVHLSLAQRQVLTITRALCRPWKLLILDEATSALDLENRDRLFALLRDLRSQGRSVLFVSHRMDELQSFVDRASVLRSGLMVGTLEQAEATPDALLKLMSQLESKDSLEHLSSLPPVSSSTFIPGEISATPVPSGVHAVKLKCDVALLPGRAPFSIDVRAWEILGVAGLEGHGGSIFLETLVGLRAPAAGAVSMPSHRDGQGTITSYRRAVSDGVVYVPGNRQVEGIFPPLSVVDNMMMATLSKETVAGWFRLKTLLLRTKLFVDRLAVEVADIKQPVDLLSGGNQQKVLVGRWLAADPLVLVMNDPLRGVDLGTKRQFYVMLRELAGSGVAIVLLSTEIEELVQVCDRTAVFREQSLEAVLDRGEMGYDEILQAMFGQTRGVEIAKDQTRGVEIAKDQTR